MSEPPAVTAPAVDSVRAKWFWFLGLGVVFGLAGLFALIAPLATGAAATLVVALALVVAGIVQIIQAFSTRTWQGFAFQLVIGLVILFGGGAMYFKPIFGAAALTLMIAVVFVAKGVFQIVLGFRLRPRGGSGWIMLAGLVALAVGMMIYADFPLSGTYAIGILAGVSLLFTGWSYVALALALRRAQ